MINVCVIGNSHLAALKLGWDKLNEDNQTSQISMTFFGAAANGLQNIEVVDNKLVPTTVNTKRALLFTSQGKDYINLIGFDAILLIGIDCDIGLIHEVLKIHQLTSMPNAEKNIMSEQCLSTIYIDKFRIEENITFSLLSKIRSISQIPVLIIPQPFRSHSSTLITGAWQDLNTKSCEALQICYYNGIKQAFKDFNITLLKQPKKTIVNYLFTRPEFSSGSVRLSKSFSVAHEENDHAHMNADYGKIVLTEAITNINEKLLKASANI